MPETYDSAVEEDLSALLQAATAVKWDLSFETQNDAWTISYVEDGSAYLMARGEDLSQVVRYARTRVEGGAAPQNTVA